MIYFENYLWYVITLPGCAWQTCLIQMLFGLWRYAGLGKDSANSVQQRINAARGLRRARPAAQILTSLRLSKFVVYAPDVGRNSRKKDQSRHRLEEKSLKS